MNQERIYKVLVGPQISEKSTLVAESGNQVVFKVALDASKLEIKRAIEKLFSVKVARVRVMRMKGKTKRNRFGDVSRSDWKKAYIRLEQGHDIDFASM
ncbi:MAG TPA: 50S ribosomal protein L23 [Pseudomonadales bacterium]|nr:50S ribosomal protein L23 [Pseudomonadales bacterium]